MSIKLVKTKGNIGELTPAQEDEVYRAFKSVVIQMRNLTLRAVPIDTGRLGASVIQYPIETQQKDTFQLGSDVEYAGYVHDGTHKMPARPFIDYAIDQLEDQIGVVIGNALQNMEIGGE